MAHILEAIMVISFGLSWPNNIITSLKNKSTKGKNLTFYILIDFGYICGMLSKVVGNNITWVFAIYVLNFVMVTTEIVLYFYYRSKEKAAVNK